MQFGTEPSGHRVTGCWRDEQTRVSQGRICTFCFSRSDKKRYGTTSEPHPGRKVGGRRFTSYLLPDASAITGCFARYCWAGGAGRCTRLHSSRRSGAAQRAPSAQPSSSSRSQAASFPGVGIGGLDLMLEAVLILMVAAPSASSPRTRRAGAASALGVVASAGAWTCHGAVSEQAGISRVTLGCRGPMSEKQVRESGASLRFCGGLFGLEMG